MQQALTIRRGGEVEQRRVVHRLRVRPAEAYVTALCAAGFDPPAQWALYPGAPTYLADERRLIFVARRPLGSARP